MDVIGHAAFALGLSDEAAQSYNASLDIRRETALPIFATEPQAGLARVALAAGAIEEALRHVEAILLQFKRARSKGRREPLRLYLTCYRVLQAVQDARAGSILKAAHTLLHQRASYIADETTRQMFLNNVPYHRELRRHGEWRAQHERSGAPVPQLRWSSCIVARPAALFPTLCAPSSWK